MADPVPDENGRLPGVDYSEQAWTINGKPPVRTLEEAMVLLDAAEQQEEQTP